MPVRALVAAGELFGIGQNGIRVEIARLMARGLITRDQRGQYRFADASEAVQDRVASWTQIDERLIEWNGNWIAVHTAGLARGRGPALKLRKRAFGFLGFRELSANLWLRPQNLRGGVSEVRRQLHALGLDPSAPVFSMDELDTEADTAARALWDTRALLASYRKMRRTLEESERHVSRLPVAQAMAETFLLGGRGIRMLTFDPLLPPPIIPGAERASFVRAMRRYNRIGRKCWSAFMRAHGAPHLRSPVNLRVVSDAGDLPAVAGA